MILEALAKLGCKKIVLKGISFEDDKIGVVVYDCAEKKAEYYFTEKVPKSSHGTGDCYAAAFTGAMMQGKTISEAAKMAADFVVDSIKKTDDGHWYGVCFERALPMLVTYYLYLNPQGRIALVLTVQSFILCCRFRLFCI